jgi:predicted transposase/invertase (TIGR01784 family)
MGEQAAIKPTNDLAFKKILASEDHKTITQGFIADLFDIRAGLDEIQIANPYSIHPVAQPPGTEQEAAARLRETLRDITIFADSADLAVELQVERARSFEQRSMYYAADLITRRKHASTASWDDTYGELRPVRLLSIAGWNLFGCPHATHSFAFRDDTWPEEGLALTWLEVRFLELRKSVFPDDRSRRWARFLATGAVPEGSPGYLHEAAGLVDYWSLTSEERAMTTLLERAREREAMERLGARDEGHEQGFARGLAQAAAGMLARGMSAQAVADITGLPVGEVARLCREQRPAE